MSTPNRFRWIGVGLVAIAGANLASAQHDWQRTVTVDPTQGAADHQTIQAAIDDYKIGDDPDERYTVLIYAGTYTIDSVAKLVELGDTKENVDLVGIDREAVIIDVTIGDAQNPRSGIKIESGGETSRNNRMANLTIKTTYGHGIEIVKGGTPVPKNITIEGVTIDASGAGKEGITGADAENVRVSDCEVKTDAGHGLVVGDQWTLTQVKVDAKNDGQQVTNAVSLDDHDSIVLKDCDLTAEARALHGEGCEKILLQGCRLATPGSGTLAVATVVFGGLSKHIRLQNCVIVNDARGTSRLGPIAVFIDTAGVEPLVEDIVFESCAISVFGGASSTLATAVRNDLDGIIDLVECNIRAQNTKQTTPASAVGVEINGIAVFGGVISTSTDAERETAVWDIKGSDQPGIDTSRISGTRLSKWHGPIKSAERPRSLIQRTIKVAAPDDDWILVETDLPTLGPGEFQEVGPSHHPDVYRTLVVKGVEDEGSFSISGNVFVVGTDWAGNQIAESFDPGNVALKDVGDKPFKTVTKIHLPIHANNVGKVKVGTTSKLGLYYPLSATGDVIQWGKKASAEDSYTIQDLTGDHGLNVDEIYATVEPKDGITADDSFEWAILASQ